MNKYSAKEIELRYVDAIYELVNIKAIYEANKEIQRAEELQKLLDGLHSLRHINYEENKLVDTWK